MRALTLHGDRDVRVENVPDPGIEHAGDAVVRVTSCAICGSDMHPYFGRESGYDSGMVPGHEFVGEVVDTGPEVKRIRVGSRVHVPFSTSCGQCRCCRMGLTARCERGELFGWRQNGSGLHGGQAELVRIPMADATAREIPEGLGDEPALLMGDVLATGFHGAEMADAGSEEGRVVAVVGCGPVGLMAVLAAFERGAERVLALDPLPERRAFAARLGAEVSSPDAAEEVIDATDGGMDAVVEAVGSEAATRLAFDLLRPGGTLASVGVHTRPSFGFTPVEAYDRNVTLRFGRCSARRWMDELEPVVRRREAVLGEIFSHRLPLEQGPDGYALAAERSADCCKILLEVG